MRGGSKYKVPEPGGLERAHSCSVQPTSVLCLDLPGLSVQRNASAAHPPTQIGGGKEEKMYKWWVARQLV